MLILVLLAAFGQSPGIDPLDEVALTERARAAAIYAATQGDDHAAASAIVYRDVSRFASRRLGIPEQGNGPQLRRIAEAAAAAHPPRHKPAPVPNHPPSRGWFNVTRNGVPTWVWGWQDPATGLIGMYDNEQPTVPTSPYLISRPQP